MRVMLYQPFYFPWIGFFDMVDQCDILVFYDDAQYSKGTWQNRNRIKTYSGVKWLTVGSDRHYTLGMKIHEIKVHLSNGWKEKNLNQIRQAYHQAPFFSEYFPVVSGFISSDFTRLIDYTSGSIRLITDVIGIKTRFMSSLALNSIKSEGTQKVIDICKAAGAEEYFDGSTGRDLYDTEFFLKQGIMISFHEYRHPTYQQCFVEFVSHLSILDLLFNEGPNSLAVIRSGRIPA